jgi:hypothetical protein
MQQELLPGAVTGDEESLMKPPEVLLRPPEGLQRVVFEGPDGGGDEPVVVEADAIIIDICP